MILGIGIDIVDNRRISKSLIKFGSKFKERCFSKNEIERSENQKNKINSYSKKFAAKEACSKALGIGFSKGIYWKDIELLNNDHGKPIIKLHNKALKLIKKITKNTNYKIDISISDEKNYSIANVIIHCYEK